MIHVYKRRVHYLRRVVGGWGRLVCDCSTVVHDQCNVSFRAFSAAIKCHVLVTEAPVCVYLCVCEQLVQGCYIEVQLSKSTVNLSSPSLHHTVCCALQFKC